MKTKQFKTNIKCTGCLSAVTPNMNNLAGEDNWKVDLDNPQKILTVDGERSEAEIIEAVKKAGFEAEVI